MPEPDNQLDDRLRAALRSLDDDARQRVRPPGADTVPPAALRHRAAQLTAMVAVLLVVAGGSTLGWRFARPVPAGAPPCAPVAAWALLQPDATTDELRIRVGTILRESPVVDSLVYETRDQTWERFKRQFSDAPELIAATKPESLPESWRFQVRCASDYPSVRKQLDGLPGVVLVCTCDKREPDKPTVSGS